MSEPRPEKTCVSCGRSFAYRKAWARVWAAVKYCSSACRSHRPKAPDRALEETILSLLRARGAGKTICPSEAARAVFGETQGLQAECMQRSRAAARRLCAQGRLVVTQGGHVVDPDRARGPIRLKLKEV
ncbi:MAG: DUF2256 and DUF3253 domain-containing protein [Deltaproteobacteria bacterium]|nr:MAG: DUF2256 and DUF3253 domain-containing protein [Deltaproteobacteria bacterium]